MLALIWILELVASPCVLMAKFREQACVKTIDEAVTTLKISGVDGLERFVNLEHLILNAPVLPAGVFDKHAQLKTLHLNGAGLESLPQGVFGQLTNLEQLYLNDNNLTELPQDVFQNLTNLVELHLSRNHLTDLHLGVFAPLTKLQRLSLNDNYLKELPEVSATIAQAQKRCLTPDLTADFAILCAAYRDLGVFDRLTQLEELDLQHNQLAKLPAGVFDGLTNLRRLFLNDNQLRAVSGLDHLKLEQLHLINNADLVGDFEQWTNLEQFDLHACVDPVNITGYDLANSTKVLAIHSFNVIGVTCAAGYSGDAKAVVCSSAGDEYMLQGCVPSSRRLATEQASYLSESRIASADTPCTWTITASSFSVQECVPSLEASITDLYISATSLEAGDLARFVNVQRLVLDVHVHALPEEIFDHLVNLELLSVSGRKLESLGEKIFDKLPNVKELFLNGTSLKSLPEGIFDKLTKLERLYLNDNHLTEMRDGVFDSLTNLTELGLHNNRLTHLYEGMFNRLTNLRRLLLGDNRITEIPNLYPTLATQDRICLQDTSKLPIFIAHHCAQFLAKTSLTEIRRGVFDKLTTLQELGLEHNQLKEVHEGTFDMLTHLERLRLNDNNLKKLPAGVFDKLPNLKWLYLFKNHFSDLQEEDFEKLNLEGLYILNACVDPDSTGYDLSNATKDFVIERFHVSGITCAAGYSGVASAIPCRNAPEPYTLEGCWPTCVEPTNITGYNLTQDPKVLVIKHFHVPGVTCAPGYAGYAFAASCTFAGGEYTLEGCGLVVDGGWSAWGECASTCGESNKFRKCNHPKPQNGGKDCEGSGDQACKFADCPIDGRWSSWGGCVCGRGGSNTKFRVCQPPLNGGNNCAGPSTQPCSHPCPVDGGWGVWSYCTKVCGGGVKKRQCDSPPTRHGGKHCSGLHEEKCNEYACPTWSEWGQCSATCGTSIRSRRCTSPVPHLKCAGFKDQQCKGPPCVIHGDWSEWGPCERSSIVGMRYRSCTNPPPSGGGTSCFGWSYKTCRYRGY